MSPPTPTWPLPSSAKHSENDKENAVVHGSKHPVLHSLEKCRPATPPLSPRRDVNAFSPSPLRLRIRGGEGDEACSQGKIDEDVLESGGGGCVDGDESGGFGLNVVPATLQDGVASCLVVSAEDPSAIGVAAGMDESGLSDPGAERVVEAEGKEGESKEGELAGAMSGEVVKSALLTVPADDSGANAVVVEIEQKMQETRIGSATQAADAGGDKKQDHSAVPEDYTSGVDSKSLKYVSPSDALMSPCTQQLVAMKAKRINSGDDSGVRSLFRNRIEKKKETGKTSKDTESKEESKE